MDERRYARQISLDKLGKKGQQALLDAHVHIVGCGGLGTIAAAYLAGAGVGSLTLIDGDSSEISNLHRQVFFKEKESGRSKAEGLKKHILEHNSDVQVEVIHSMLSPENISSALEEADLVLECTDNIMTKYLINDFCFEKRIPMIYGAVHKYEGLVSFFPNRDDESIHLRDAFPTPDTTIPTCSEVGVLNTITGIIGLFQANEAIKFITDCGPNLSGKLLTYDALNNEQQSIKLKKSHTFSSEEEEVMDREGNTVSFHDIPAITFAQIKDRLNDYRIVSLLEEGEFVPIAQEVEQVPYSEIYWNDWIDDGRPTVFYCTTGMRSAEVVYDLMRDHPDAKIFYLKGKLEEVLDEIKA